MARMPDSFRRRAADTQVMFAVRYADGRSAYIRVSKDAAQHGGMVVLSPARKRQQAGEIPDGVIASVLQVTLQPVLSTNHVHICAFRTAALGTNRKLEECPLR